MVEAEGIDRAGDIGVNAAVQRDGLSAWNGIEVVVQGCAAGVHLDLHFGDDSAIDVEAVVPRALQRRLRDAEVVLVQVAIGIGAEDARELIAETIAPEVADDSLAKDVLISLRSVCREA